MFRTTLQSEDALALYAGIGSNDRKIPTRVITRADFLTCPDANLGLPVPYPYGDLRNTLSATDAPTLTGTASRGAKVLDGVWTLGFGDLTSGATPPTGTTVTAAGTGTVSKDVPSAKYGVIVSGVDADGNESNPYPFYTNELTPSGGSGTFASIVATDTVDGTQEVQVSWSGGSATTYRCYLAYYYYGAFFVQVIETASTSCTFTTSPAFGVDPTPDNVTPAADPVTFGQVWEYAVSAVMSDGETALSSVAVGRVRPYQRPLRIEWVAVPSVLAYRVYKRAIGQSKYIFRFDVSAAATYFDDDLTNDTAVEINGAPQFAGMLPCVHVGQKTDANGATWEAFLVAGCAIKEIIDVYQGGVKIASSAYGSTFAVPGKTGFSSLFGSTTYVDINSRRYTLLYARGTAADAAVDGSRPLSVTLKGIERTGDGSGVLITDLAEQYEHCLRNLVLRDYTSGNWQTSGPLWGDTPIDVDQVDGESFDAVTAVWALRGPGACPGAWVLGLSESGALEQVTVRTQLARLNQSLDAYGGFSRKSQYIVKTINELASLTEAVSFTATLGINGDSFEIEDRPDEIENQIVVRYALDAPNGTWQELTVEDVDAQTALDGEIKPYTLTLWAIRTPGVAYEIGRRRLQRRKFPYRFVRWESDMGGLLTDLGDTVLVTHPDGAGANGWTDRPVFILRHEFDPQRFVVQFEGLDLYAIRAGEDTHPATTVTVGSATTGHEWLWTYGVEGDAS